MRASLLSISKWFVGSSKINKSGFSITTNNNKNKKQKSVLKTNNSNNLISKSSIADLKKKLTYSEKKIFEYEKEKKLLEIEMLNKNFYASNNQKRAQEVNVNLQKILLQIAEEEKIWEKIAENIEIISWWAILRFILVFLSLPFFLPPYFQVIQN